MPQTGWNKTAAKLEDASKTQAQPEGEGNDPRPVLLPLLRSGNSHLLLMAEDDEDVGYDIVSFTPEFVLGHQTWIRPEKRGQGLWRKYLAEVRELGKSLGCRQFRFTSTLEEWNNRAPKLGLRRIEWKTGNGVTATTWGVEV